MNEHEARVDEAAAAVDLIDEQIAKALAKKDAATERGERDEYDRALRDIQYLGDRKKLAETNYQRVRAEADAAERAAKLAELEELKTQADRDAALAEIETLLVDARAAWAEIRGRREHARRVAEEQRARAQRCRELSRSLGVVGVFPPVDDDHVVQMFRKLSEE